MIKKTLAITDLQFSSSQDTLQKSLQQVPGVQFVSVHLTSQTMDITYDESMITIQQLVDKIETLGYQVSVLDAGKTELLPVHPQKRKVSVQKEHTSVYMDTQCSIFFLFHGFNDDTVIEYGDFVITNNQGMYKTYEGMER